MVKSWKKGAFGKPTLSNMAGIKGVDEGSASGMSVMMLDMLQHIGILERVDGIWKTKEGYKLRRPIMVGDAKSLENFLAWMRKVERRSMTIDQCSMMAETFLDAFSVVMLIPGDWHAGLAMLQSISTLFWSIIIDPFIELLDLKRIYPEARKNYFSLKRIVSYIANELIRLFQYEYVSIKEAFTSSDDGAQFLCSMSIGFIDFLQEIAERED